MMGIYSSRSCPRYQIMTMIAPVSKRTMAAAMRLRLNTYVKAVLLHEKSVPHYTAKQCDLSRREDFFSQRTKTALICRRTL